jgi:hypothetical protein
MEDLAVLHKNKANEVDEQWEEVLKCRQKLRDRSTELDSRREALEETYKSCTELCGNIEAAGDDKIKLNVGGVRVVCRRSILTLFPTSKLAMLFNGRWDKKLLRDKKNRFFIDVNPDCFKKILDYHMQLVQAAAAADSPPPLPRVSEDLQPTFSALCAFFEVLDFEAPTNRLGYTRKKSAAVVSDAIDVECYALSELLREERCLLDQREHELAEDESRFLKETDFADFMSSGETKDIVELDVSGQVMDVKRSTLRLCEDSVLSCQFDDAAWCQDGQQSGSDSEEETGEGVFIEQPAYAFSKVIDQLRLMAITAPDLKTTMTRILPHEKGNYVSLVRYYFPGQENLFIPEIKTLSSEILTSKPHQLLLHQWLQESMPELMTEVELSLLYKASRDGFKPHTFHEKCDDNGATVTIVTTKDGYIFGGFNDKSWHTGDAYLSSSRAFLFSFVNPSGHPPVKLPLLICKIGESRQASRCGSTFGPSFGRCIQQNQHSRLSKMQHLIDLQVLPASDCCSKLGGTYTLPPGQNSDSFLAGASVFEVLDMEVFSVR